MERKEIFYIKLNHKDNVVVALRDIKKGTCLLNKQTIVVVREDIKMGHKISTQKISKNEKVIKCGTSIGHATMTIKAGRHVHTHNLESDFIHTYTLSDVYNG